MKRLAGATMLGVVAGLIVSGGSATAATGDVTEYAVPTGNSSPGYIAAGPDGNLWFTEQSASGNKVAKVTTTGAFTEYPLPDLNQLPAGIVAGPDGNLWFTEARGPKVAKVTTAGVITQYTLPTASSGPEGIAVGPDGNLWVAERDGNKVASVTTAGLITEYSIPTASSQPSGIAAGPDGNLWVTEQAGNKLAKVTTAGLVTEYAAAGAPYGIAAGPDGNLWFTEYNGNKVARITTAGVITEYPLVTAGSTPVGIAAGPDGNIWFAEQGQNKVANVTPLGVITEYTLAPPNRGPRGIAVGPDGNMWFTGANGNIVAKIVASPTCTAASVPVSRMLSSTGQYWLADSDGAIWQDIDASKLRLTCLPTATQSILLTANADLFTGSAGYNQDLGIFVSDNGSTDQLLAWKESGGFAGTLSPNAAYVQDVFNMVTGHTYVFKLKWKTNKPAAGATIYAGAGNGPYSPTSLIAETFPTGVVPNFAVSTSQYWLANSDGATWQPIDAVNLSTTLAPTANATAVLGANADLWTIVRGYNQDLAIFVSDNAGPDTLVGWKESGGFAGTYSPNAAFLKATYAMTAAHTYTFKLKWKSNKDATGTGATIYAAAGGPAYSQTSLLAATVATTAASSTVSTNQYNLPSSDGVTWQTIEPAINGGGPITTDTNAIIGGNADLWTAWAGVNQDLGIFVSDNGGADALLAWKESGGFAGTYSPNAAFVQATYLLTGGHTYIFKLKWKTNKNDPYARIYVGAGGPGVFSPTRLTIELTN
jgi:streptogramin lyase